MSGVYKTEPGKVDWQKLKEELLEQSKEVLIELINSWAKNYWSNQGYWLLFVERDFGTDIAARLDGEIWEHMAKAQAHRLIKTFKLGSDIQALATVLKYCAAQWVTAGFEWEFLEITEKKIVMQVNKCPMGTFRDSQNLPLFPCKLGAPPLYISLATTVNPNIKTTCLHAHPDDRIEGIMCKWEFILEEK